MFKALLCFCLLAGSVFARAQEKEKDKDPQTSEHYLTLKKTYEAMPFTVVLDAGQPVQLVWKDGSRVAELQIGTKSLKLDIPLSVSQNTCGNKATGLLCKSHFLGNIRGLRMIWKKHPQADRVGKPITVGGTAFEALDFDQIYSTQLAAESFGNNTLLSSLPGELLPLTCKGSDWLPPSENGARHIISIAQDGTDNNNLSPENLVQTGAELYDLTLMQKDANRFYIKHPENPYFNIGANNSTMDNDRQDSDGDLLGEEGSIITLKQGADMCRVQLRSAIEASEIFDQFANSPMKTAVPTFAEFLMATEVPDPTPKDPNFRRSRFYGAEYHQLMKFHDKNLAEAVRLLNALNLIGSGNVQYFIAGNCRTEITEISYCDLKAKDLQ